MSEHTEGTFTSATGQEIYWQSWGPDAEVLGVLVIAHGLAEHGGRYSHVADRLTSAGYAVYAPDHRGHGRSSGRRANINRMSELAADLRQVIEMASKHHPDRPVFLHGHSMGGLLALDCVITHRSYAQGEALRGLTLSGPAVNIAVGSSAERTAGKVLSAVMPNLGILTLDPALVSRDPAVVTAYNADPLVYHGKVLARTGAEMLAASERVTSLMSTVELPVLVMHGTEDGLAAVSSAETIADAVTSTDVTVRLYDGLYHEIFNEPEQDQVLDDFLAWLTARS